MILLCDWSSDVCSSDLPSVKAAADIVTTDNDSDGVALVIEKLLRGEL